MSIGLIPNISPLTYKQISLFVNNSAQSSCCVDAINLYYSTSNPSEFADFNTPPSAIYTDSSGTTAAPSAYYKSAAGWTSTTTGTARYWNNATETWGDVYDCTQEGTTCS